MQKQNRDPDPVSEPKFLPESEYSRPARIPKSQNQMPFEIGMFLGSDFRIVLFSNGPSTAKRQSFGLA